MLKEPTPDPNLFEGDYIESGKVASRMKEIIKRENMALSLRDIDHLHLNVETIPMTSLHEYHPRVTREHVQRLIRNVMVGSRIGAAFDSATHLIEVSQHGVNAPVAAALLHIDMFGGSDAWTRSGYGAHPQVSVDAFGMETSPSGKVNHVVADRLADAIIDYSNEVNDLLLPHFAILGVQEFTPSVYLTAAHGALPTIESVAFHNRFFNLMKTLNILVIAPTEMGTGFSEKIISMNAALNDMRKHHADHALVKAMEHSQAWDLLDQRRVNQGGDPQMYKTMQKAATALYRLFRAINAGIEDAFLHLHPATGAGSNATSEVTASNNGDVSVAIMDSYNRASANFSPRDKSDPVIEFKSDYEHKLTADVAGKLWKEVTGGTWWQRQMSNGV